MKNKRINETLIKKLINISIIEGISLIILVFIAMPIKYILHYPIAVRIMGSIHGILWLIFLYILYRNVKENELDKNTVIKLVIFSVIPFGFFYIEKLLKKNYLSTMR